MAGINTEDIFQLYYDTLKKFIAEKPEAEKMKRLYDAEKVDIEFFTDGREYYQLNSIYGNDEMEKEYNIEDFVDMEIKFRVGYDTCGVNKVSKREQTNLTINPNTGLKIQFYKGDELKKTEYCRNDNSYVVKKYNLVKVQLCENFP